MAEQCIIDYFYMSGDNPASPSLRFSTQKKGITSLETGICHTLFVSFQILVYIEAQQNLCV